MLEGLLVGLAVKALRQLIAKHATDPDSQRLLEALVLEVVAKIVDQIKHPSPETLAVGKVWRRLMADGIETDPLKAFRLARRQLGYEK